MPKKSQKQPAAPKSGKSKTRPGVSVTGLKSKKLGRARQATASTGRAKEATLGRQASTQKRANNWHAAPTAQRLVATGVQNIKSERAAKSPRRNSPKRPSNVHKDHVLERAASAGATSDSRAEDTIAPAVSEAGKIAEMVSEPSELKRSKLGSSGSTFAPFAMILRHQALSFRLVLDALELQRKFISRAFHQ